MLLNLRQFSPGLSPSPDIGTIPPPSSHRTFTAPSIGGDRNLWTLIPVYQLHSPGANNRAPYGHGFGLAQNYANPMQFGDHNYVITPPIQATSQITNFPIQNPVPKCEVYMETQSLDPAVAQILANNRLMDRRISDLYQLFAGQT